MVLLALALAAISLAILPALAADQDDSTIRPGIGLGIVKLGMDREQIVKTAGNIDGSYTLPTGTKVDFALWKEDPPKKSPTIRYFYDADGKVIQISESAPVPATAEGISCKSTLAEVRAKYKHLRQSIYINKTTRTHIHYYDDPKRGIAFKSTREEGTSAYELNSILVHKRGKRFIADADEINLAIKGKKH